MNLHKVNIKNTIDEPWLIIKPILIGPVSSGIGTPDFFVTVTFKNRPYLRLDVYLDNNEYSFKEEVRIWHNFILIGAGERCYIVDLLNNYSVTVINLHYYFCEFTHAKDHGAELINDYLLIVSGNKIFRLEPDGTIKWTTEDVGIDGVVVHDIDNKIIRGSGEWDPPDGWIGFKLDAETGMTVTS